MILVFHWSFHGSVLFYSMSASLAYSPLRALVCKIDAFFFDFDGGVDAGDFDAAVRNLEKQYPGHSIDKDALLPLWNAFHAVHLLPTILVSSSHYDVVLCR